MENKPLEIWAEVTPNPNTLKFNVNRKLIESGSLNFPDKDKAKGNYLPEQLFAVKDVIGVMVGPSFITLTKTPTQGWQDIVPAATEKLKELLNSDKALLPADATVVATASGAPTGDIEKKIREILDNEIRPAVAMDGGDITFYGFQDGVVTLHLQGSCSSCPSSIMTLKMGVENRLKASIPEVREVVQV